ncbi:MAG: HEAT repeat domain-containing protein [Limisphaerales bacterium]
MRNRLRLLLTITCVSATLCHSSAQEPTSSAHSLQQWVTILGIHNNRTDYENAQRAIQYVGTNAIPLLLQWIAYDPHRPSDWPPGVAYGDPQQFALANDAVYAFRTLGPAAAPALPGLSNLVAASGCARAIEAMGYIRPDSLPYLIAILTNGTPRARGSAALALAGFGTNARPAVPALILCLTNSVARDCAFKSLAYLNLEPKLVVPTFTNLATDPTVRETAIRMLGAMGENARAALPTITSALNDTNEYVRWTATNTLQNIAPEMLRNTPGK